MNNESAELTTNLTLSDLKVVATIIEACALKGVFRSNDLTTVGVVYDKIASILSSVNNNK